MFGTAAKPADPTAKTLTLTGVAPVDPAGPLTTSERLGKATSALTNGALAAVGSAPDVVSVKFTLPPDMLAVMVLWRKFTPPLSVLPRNLLLACPFESVGVVLPNNNDPCPDAIAHVTVTPACGWPWASFTTTIMGVCAAKFCAA